MAFTYDEYSLALTAASVVIVFVTLLVTIWHWYSKRTQILVSDVPLPQVGPFDGQGVRCTCEHGCALHDRQPESVVVGSNFTKVPPSKIPKNAIGVYSAVKTNGRFALQRYLGVAVRIQDYLVVPYHVICSEEVVILLTMRTAEDPLCYKVSTSDFTLIDGDVAAMKMDEATFSKLGMVKSGIAPIEGEMMVAVTSAAKEPEISFGILTNDSKVFGGVVFRGSTRGGFSGAPYMVGKQIAGVHLGGGVMNYGVSASYILALLNKPEDTAEWLQKMRRTKGPLKYQRSKHNPDEAIVFVDGKYHTVDLEMLESDEEVSFTEPFGVVRQPEVNLSANFPPQYVDEVRPLVEGINNITEEVKSKNLQAAEGLSADLWEAHVKRHAELMNQLDEKVMLLQSMQDSVANRYREVQRLLAQVPKGDAGREALVAENEKMKLELSEIKKLKTDVNVEVSSVKAVPKSVRKAKAKSESATVLDKVQASGFSLEEIIQALTNAGIVERTANAGASVGNAGITIASVVVPKVTKVTPELPSSSQK